jgi:type I restriction enzyme R subunit
MTPTEKPEERARVLIDEQLARAGWYVCDRSEIDLVNHRGVAVREVIMNVEHGRADYLLYVDREVVGVIEAKPVGTPLAGVQWQAAMYAEGLPESYRAMAVIQNGRLPFIYEASGTETQFTSGFDPYPRARKIFNFQQPETLARFIRDFRTNPSAPTWRAKVINMPSYDKYDLRPASKVAVGALESSLAAGTHSRSLVQMATGAGKTRMAVTECYRLLQYGGFDRILFLVDRNNLGDQTLREFRDFDTPDDGRKFTELYNVNKLTGAGLAQSSKVVISTIQRVFAALRGLEVTEEDDPNIDGLQPSTPVQVEYSAAMPPETFDLIIVDECHRSIYGTWRGVLDYFDAHVVGLTATPTKRTFGYFQQNLVSEYTFAESVADGVNVDFDVYRIQTDITGKGSKIGAGTIVPMMDRRTRQQRLEELDDDFEYTGGDLDRAVTTKSQIRLVLETFRDRLYSEIFPPPYEGGPRRSVVPKTLIFAKDDNHAEEIVNTVREVFGKGNDFAAKITYNAKDPKALLQKFRNSPELRIAVTVDMIATGTDVKPIECVMFMRDVRSRTYFEQMKGRGARTMLATDFQGVTPDATSKERFVIVDAVGVTEHDHVDAAPLDRNPTISLERLLEQAANFSISAEDVTTLGSRLARLERSLTPKEQVELTDVAGMDLRHLITRLFSVTDPDVLVELVENAPPGPDGQADGEMAIRNYINEVVTPLAGNPALRQRLTEIRALHDRVIDEVSLDTLITAGGVVDYDKARDVIASWSRYLEDNKDEISLIHVLYSQPRGAKVTFRELSDLADRIAAPPRSLSIDLIWNAYRALKSEHVRKSAKHTSTDLISLIRFTLEQEQTLVPYGDLVEERYQGWLDVQQQAGVIFTESQSWWLERIKDTIVQSAQFTVDDLELAPFTERGGSDGIGRDLGSQALDIIKSMSEALAV